MSVTTTVRALIKRKCKCPLHDAVICVANACCQSCRCG